MLEQAQKMADILANMPNEQRESLLNAHREFGRLRSICEARGEIEILPKLTGIKVLKNTGDVKKLKEVVDLLKPGGFKWLNTKGIDELSKKR